MLALVVVLLVVIVAAPAPAPAAAAGAHAWERPVAGPVVRGFAVGADRFAAGQHRGVDLGAPPGAPVRAACGGRVSFAGRVPGGGRTVSVRCDTLVATYQHLGLVAVRRGQVVARGRRLGTIGRSGSPQPGGAHLHLGARRAQTGRYVDPLTLLGGATGHLPPSPPPARLTRPPPPLGPAPLGPAARPERLPRPVSPPQPFVVAAPAPAPALPWAVWLGLACAGLGLPLGAFVRVSRRRRRLTPAVTALVASSGVAAPHR